MLPGHLFDHRHRRLRQDADRRHDDLELALAQFVDGQEGLVLPGQQDIADAALDEGGGRTTGAGVEDRDVAEQFGDERLGLGLGRLDRRLVGLAGLG